MDARFVKDFYRFNKENARHVQLELVMILLTLQPFALCVIKTAKVVKFHQGFKTVQNALMDITNMSSRENKAAKRKVTMDYPSINLWKE